MSPRVLGAVQRDVGPSQQSLRIVRGFRAGQPDAQRGHQGAILDVAVDIRRGSPTFGRWVGVLLSAEQPRMLWVPPGFAHGFYVLSDVAEFVYKCTDYYAPQHERSLRWDDPDLAIDWPLLPEQPPLLSAKDQQGQWLVDAELYP